MRRIFARPARNLRRLHATVWRLTLALVLAAFLMMLLGNSISLTVTGMPLVVQDLDDLARGRESLSTPPPIHHVSCGLVAGVEAACPSSHSNAARGVLDLSLVISAAIWRAA